VGDQGSKAARIKEPANSHWGVKLSPEHKQMKFEDATKFTATKPYCRGAPIEKRVGGLGFGGVVVGLVFGGGVLGVC